MTDGGKNKDGMERMRLDAAREDVYALMDDKDAYLAMTLISAGLSLGGVVLMAAGHPGWKAILLLVSALFWTVLFAVSFKDASDRIMDVGGCYIELGPNALVVRQAARNGKHEFCRACYDEVERVVEVPGGARPRFYIALKTEERMSHITGGRAGQSLFLVRSFGYKKREFKEFYGKLLLALPKGVSVSGMGGGWSRKDGKSSLPHRIVCALAHYAVCMGAFFIPW